MESRGRTVSVRAAVSMVDKACRAHGPDVPEASDDLQDDPRRNAGQVHLHGVLVSMISVDADMCPCTGALLLVLQRLMVADAGSCLAEKMKALT